VTTDRGSRALRAISLGVFVVGALASLTALVSTWGAAILEAHSFRQTQTGLTAYWLAQGGPIFAYETPVLGAPWSVPFEFPLYQMVVAAVHALTRIELDATGRLVSWLFFVVTLTQVHAIVRMLGGSRYHGLLLCGLLLLSPHYIFWSRTFMIESAALCLAVAFVAVTMRHVRAPQSWTAIAMVALACMAALVKVTTFVPFGLAAGLIVAWDLRVRAHWSDVRRWWQRYLPVVVSGICAAFAMYLWSRHADALKLEHPFGRNLTADNLRPWIYGTMKQRLDSRLWTDVVFGRTLHEALGARLPLLAAVASAVALGWRAIAWVAVLLVLYVVPFAVFTNLHWVHDYYQYANALFVVAIITVVVAHADAGWRRYIAFGLLALTVSFQLVRVVRVEARVMRATLAASDTLPVARALKGIPDGVVIVFGFDWSSEVAYYLERRTMTVPMWSSREQLESLRSRPELHTGGLPVVAVVECNNALRGSPELGPIVEAIIEHHTRDMQHTAFGACTVWR
jgi:hypothetical protein